MFGEAGLVPRRNLRDTQEAKSGLAFALYLRRSQHLLAMGLSLQLVHVIEQIPAILFG
jgi:hypothetical protein